MDTQYITLFGLCMRCEIDLNILHALITANCVINSIESALLLLATGCVWVWRSKGPVKDTEIDWTHVAQPQANALLRSITL